MTLADLIARLEAAEQGSLDLTADIYEAIGCEVIRTPRTPNGIAWKYRGRGPSGRVAERWEVTQDFTESIDAALSLVPEGWRLHLLADQYGSSSACLHRAFGAEEDLRVWKIGHSWPVTCTALAQAPTKPLALCIAALRARLAK